MTIDMTSSYLLTVGLWATWTAITLCVNACERWGTLQIGIGALHAFCHALVLRHTNNECYRQ